MENGSYKLRGFDDILKPNFDFDGKTGKLVRINAKKRLMRLFSQPFEVPIIHEVGYKTHADTAAQKAKKQKGYGNLVSKPKEWSCSRCHKVNDDKFCSGCGKPRESWQ